VAPERVIDTVWRRLGEKLGDALAPFVIRKIGVFEQVEKLDVARGFGVIHRLAQPFIGAHLGPPGRGPRRRPRSKHCWTFVTIS